MKRTEFLFCAVSLVMASAAPMSTAAQEAKRPDLAALFDKREAMVPVRDGAKLHGNLHAEEREGAVADFV